MGLYQSFAGSAEVRLEAADIPDCFKMMEKEKISASQIRTIDSVTLELTVSRKNLSKLRKLCERKGYRIQLKQKRGLFWSLRAMIRRPAVVIGLLLLTLLAACLPGRILFVETEGNETIPTRFILECAQDCGLRFWSCRREVRSEQIKNELLEAIPQLQWVGVNTYGCRAVITVRERSAYPDEQKTGSVSHIVASRDGVIHSRTVTHGFGNCTVGQVVRKGDVLISGFTDCGLTIVAERAEGEVLALTKRSVSLVTPANCKIQSLSTSCDERFSLLIGKKRINFYKGSGISGGSCDKMYSKYVLTLPGGFSLPVAILKETTFSSCLTETAVNQPASLLEASASAYLMEQMKDGAILQKTETLRESDGLVQLNGVYDCQENIGIVQEEKIGEFDG